MNKKVLFKVSTIIIVAIVLGGLLVPSIGIAADLSSSNVVTESEAYLVAANHINNKSANMPEWSNAKVSYPVSYFSPDKTVCAYEFTVKDEEKEVGFIITSARKDWMPVLEYGSGKSPSSYVNDSRQIAIEKSYINENDKSEPCIFYWGACTYSMQVGEKMKNERAVINLTSGRKEVLPKETPVLQMDTQRSKEAWSNIPGVSVESPLSTKLRSLFSPAPVFGATEIWGTDQQIKTSPTIVNLSGIPIYYQSHYFWFHGDDHDQNAEPYDDCVGNPDDLWEDWDGCAPISGAMLIGFWRNNGYTALPDTAYQETEEILIDHCHARMGTSVDGFTTGYNINDGMLEVTNDVYYCDFNSDEMNISWSNVTSEIGTNSRPFMLCMTDNNPFGDHCVCAYGYEDEGGASSIRVFTTTNTDQNYYITYNNWSSAAIVNLYP